MNNNNSNTNKIEGYDDEAVADDDNNYDFYAMIIMWALDTVRTCNVRININQPEKELNIFI